MTAPGTACFPECGTDPGSAGLPEGGLRGNRGNPDTAEIGDVLIDFLYIPVRNRALGIAAEYLAF